jgi:hypothetical protein
MMNMLTQRMIETNGRLLFDFIELFRLLSSFKRNIRRVQGYGIVK